MTQHPSLSTKHLDALIEAAEARLAGDMEKDEVDFVSLREGSEALKRILVDKQAKPKKSTRLLGKVQKDVLNSLISHGSWFPTCGWLWDTMSNTQKILDSLVRRGVVHVKGNIYRPVTEEVKK